MLALLFSLTVALPIPTGPHGVGTTTFFWVDRSRTETATADTGDLRQVMAQVWYPAIVPKGAVTAGYFPQLDDVLLALRTRSDDLSKVIASQSKQAGVRTHAVVDAPLARGDARLPVIVISPGGNVSRHSHTALAEELASRGYVVAVLSHAYNGWDMFPAGGFVKSIDWGINDSNEEKARRSEDVLADVLAADASFTLDRLAEMNASRFGGRLDLDHVAIIGHSRGGLTVARTCSKDARAVACVTLDNIGPERETDEGLSKPQMTIRTSSWNASRVDRLHGFLSRNKAGAIEATIGGTIHMNFTDMTFIDPVEFKSDIEPERAHRVVSSLVAAFLDEHLRHMNASVENVAKAFPEVRITRFAPAK